MEYEVEEYRTRKSERREKKEVGRGRWRRDGWENGRERDKSTDQKKEE